MSDQSVVDSCSSNTDSTVSKRPGLSDSESGEASHSRKKRLVTATTVEK